MIIKTPGTTYKIIEYAGYEEERIICGFPSYRAALVWVMEHYDDGEAERLHVGIRRDVPGEDSEYV